MGVPPISHLGTKCLEVTYDIGSAELIFLPRHQTVLLGSALPHNGKRLPGWPWDGRPIFGVGVVRSFPWRKSQRTRRMAPRAMLGAARFSVVEKKCSSHIPRTKIAQMEMLITSFFSNIFSWTQSRTERSSGQRFYPRPPHGRFPGSSCPQSDGHPPGGPESPARS